ncbi:MAG: hypothetical protein AAF612_11395 [Planctomycetota bacterium]
MSAPTEKHADAGLSGGGRRRGWFRRRWKTLALSAAGLSLVAGLSGVAALRASPSVWREHQAFLERTNPEQRAALVASAMRKLDAAAERGMASRDAHAAAEAVESDGGVAGVAARALRPDERRLDLSTRVVLTNDELAALVSEKYEAFLRQRGFQKPADVHDPMLAVRDGDLVLAFEYSVNGFSTVFSGEFELVFLADGMAELRLRSLSAGNLPLPATGVADFLSSHHPGEARVKWDRVAGWIGKLRGLEFRPVLELEHRRRARVTGYEVLEEGVAVDLRLQDHATYKEMNLALARSHGTPDHMARYYPRGLPRGGVWDGDTPAVVGAPVD